MPILLVLLALMVGLMVWFWRPHGAAAPVRPLSRRSGGSRGTPARLDSVRDARLAATILMIQLVRTGAPVMESEKRKILDLLDHPLDVDDPLAMFDDGWAYTEARGQFSRTADALVGILRRQLTVAERLQLIGMLTEVANAYVEAGDLQLEAIERLKQQLIEG